MVKFDTFHSTLQQFQQNYMAVLKTVIFSVLVLLASSIGPRHYTDYASIRHGVSDQCCLTSGGRLCGRVIKTCCDKDGCAKTWYGEICKGDYYSPECRTCSDECTSLPHGTVCAVSVSTAKIDCCSLENCEKSTGGLGDRIIDKAIQKTTSYTSSLLKSEQAGAGEGGLKHQGLADKLIDKLAGPNSKCKPNTLLELPRNCIQDSITSLLAARLF